MTRGKLLVLTGTEGKVPVALVTIAEEGQEERTAVLHRAELDSLIDGLVRCREMLYGKAEVN